ncbi:MAG TPA: hypothetical protein VFI47_02425 [Acidimicrobiales bacterium]|nr:hypothetical protein [Acidimicrobiales bacterium]
MTVHRPRAGLLALIGLATTLGAVACGSSGYQYVQNDELGVYAKVPDDWAVYDEEALFPDDSERERERRLAVTWTRSFDASDDPSPDHSKTLASAEPTGRVRVFGLPPEFREQVNLSALRGLGMDDPQLDPVALSQQESGVQVVSDEPVTFDGGYHGVRTVFTIDPQAAEATAGGDMGTVVVDQTTVLNSTSDVVYIFQVSCTEQCYFDTHKDAIADIVDSWTIQEVRS